MKEEDRRTERSSEYEDLEKASIRDLLGNMNKEDHKVPDAVEKVIPSIEELVKMILPRMKEKGGRLFYIGAGTSGRLGIVDASECPPTFGVPHGLVIGLMAGGDSAMRKAVEFAEDDPGQSWKDLKAYDIDENDSLIGIAASGTTPYVKGGLETAGKNGILTGAITCNPGSPVGKAAQFPIEVDVGPEFLTGSTRLKSGTAQKLILNMISTSLMIKLGKVKGNEMVDMQLSNDKLVERGTRMVMKALGTTYETSKELLLKEGSVRKAVERYKNDPSC